MAYGLSNPGSDEVKTEMDEMDPEERNIIGGIAPLKRPTSTFTSSPSKKIKLNHPNQRGKRDLHNYKQIQYRSAKPIDLWQEDQSSLYGLDEQYLNKLGIKLPLTKWIRVQNINTTHHEGKELFSLAGDIQYFTVDDSSQCVEIMYSHPVEAVQAVSLFNDQKYNDSKLSVTMTLIPPKELIPRGMESIGAGLGINGAPLRDVMRQMERYVHGFNANIDVNVLDKTYWNSSEMDAEQSSPEDKDSSKASPENEDRRTINELNESTANTSKGVEREMLPEKALVPEKVAKKVVTMIKRGWTATEIEEALNSADKQRSFSLQVLQPNAINMAAVSQTNVRHNAPMVGVTGPLHGGTRPKSANTGPYDCNSMPNRYGSGQQNVFYGINRGNSSQLPAKLVPMSNHAPLAPPMWNPVQMSTESSLATVQLSNLPPSVTFPFLHEKMSLCGEVKFVRFTDPGSVLVGYSNVWEAEQCINMFNKTVVEGHEVRVNFVRAYNS